MLHEVETIHGRRAVIITHKGEATMVQRKRVEFMYRHQPVRPRLDVNNHREISFPTLDSTIYAGTAGGREFGRSDTIHWAHCSEYAFWQHPAIMAGLMQPCRSMGGSTSRAHPTATIISTHCGKRRRRAPRLSNRFSSLGSFTVSIGARQAYLQMSGRKRRMWRRLKAAHWKVELSAEQVAWRRYKIAEMKAADPEGRTSFLRNIPRMTRPAFW